MIQLTHIHKIYNQKTNPVHCLTDISIDFSNHEFSVIAGPSGSGKTTLLNIIGLLDRPTKGEYILDGKNVLDKSSQALADIRRDEIGFIFQAYNLMPVLTVLENTEMVMELRGEAKQSRRKSALEVLEILGISDLKDRYPSQLSGGQQQRVAVARAIAGRPKLVIADEPTANLDSKTADSLMTLMESLHSEHGISFIFSSHDPVVISRAKRNIELRDGRINKDQLVDNVTEATYSKPVQKAQHATS